MADRIGYKKAENDGKSRAQIFYEKIHPEAKISEQFIDLLKRGDERSSDPENTPCSFLTGLRIDPKEYSIRIVNTDHLIKSGYIVCDVSQEHSAMGDYSEIYLMKINSSFQDLDLPTRVGYVLQRVIHSEPCQISISEKKSDQGRGNNPGNYTAPRPVQREIANSRWA